MLILLLSAQVFVSTGFGIVNNYFYRRDEAPSGFSINGINLSGLTESQALTKLEQQIPTGVTYNSRVFYLQTVQSKADLARWLAAKYYLFSNPSLSGMLSILGYNGPEINAPDLNKTEIIMQLKHIAEQINRAATPAGILFKGHGIVRTPAQEGLQLDIKSSWRRLNIARSNLPVALVVDKVEALPDDYDAAQIKDTLADYTTYFNPAETARTSNIRLAAKILNNKLIAPGSEFSFNDTVGNASKAAGYLPADIFSSKQVVTGEGGGICQDSSTLYLAVKQAKLPVLERHRHSLPVAYAPMGQDATVYFGALDFRFRNNTKDYILLHVSTGTNWLRVQIFGHADSEHPVNSVPDRFYSRMPLNSK